MKTKLSKLVQQLNAENAPSDGWRPEDQVAAVEETVPHVDIIEANKPEAGKVYALTGGPGSRCIANGNSWSESEVTDADPAAGHTDDRGTR